MKAMAKFLGVKPTSQISSFISHLDQTVIQNQLFCSTVDQWRNCQIHYLGQLIQLQNRIRDKVDVTEATTNNQLLNLLEIVVKSHKAMITKMNQQLFQSCIPDMLSILDKQRKTISEEKAQMSAIVNKKEQLIKKIEQTEKLRRSFIEQSINQIFSFNSFSNVSANRMKITENVEKLQFRLSESEEKLKSMKEKYSISINSSKLNAKHFEQEQQSFRELQAKAIQNAATGLSTFNNSLKFELQKHFKDGEEQQPSPHSKFNKCTPIFEQEFEKISKTKGSGYLQKTLSEIKSRGTDKLIEYTKKKEVKEKIKKLIEQEQIIPEQTQSLSRQIQLIKKIIRRKQENLLEQFRVFTKKSLTFRINFVFFLQMYRLNSQFQMKEDEVQIVKTLINQVLSIAHHQKDIFTIKHILVLLSTYYMHVIQEGEEVKIYLIEFFAKNSLWEDQEIWQSILIESIYSERKKTIRNLVVNSKISKCTELAQAQKTLILNQILFVAKNMLLLGVETKNTKNIILNFVKLLKQDDKFLQNVDDSLNIAIEEQKGC